MATKTGQLRDLEGRHQQLLRLVELSVTLNSTLDLDELLQLITETATDLLNCEAASILLYDQKNPRLYFAAATGSDPAELAKIPVPMEGSIAGTIFRTNQPMIQNHVEQDPRHYANVSDQVKFKTRTLLGVPMPIKDRVVGVLEAINKNNDGEFNQSDVAILSVTAAHAAIAINNARLLQQTKQALEKVTETNSIKSHFLALASHELRTPLGIIIGYASFLQDEAKGELSDHANQVLNAAAQMRSILDQMNNLTLLQADEMEMRPMKISIQDILNFACEELMYSIARRNLALTFAFNDDPIYVNVDQEKTTLGIREFDEQCHTLFPRGRTDRDRRNPARRRCYCLGAGQWHRHPRGQIAKGVRRVLPDRAAQHTSLRRAGNWTHHRKGIVRSAGRKALGRIRRLGQRLNFQSGVANSITCNKKDLINRAKGCIFIVDTEGDRLMLTKVQKWGNSLALRIPKAFALDAQLENDSFVEISIVDGQIVITPVAAPSWTLEELLAGINKNNIHQEVDTGSAVGNEVW